MPSSRRLVLPASNLLALLFLVALSTSLYSLPLNRVIERRVCRDYYLDHDPSVLGPDGVDELLCKIEPVQKSLGSTQGVMETILIVGDFIMTIPLSILSQRPGGRRFVLLMNLSSRIILLTWILLLGSSPLIVLGPAVSLLGGDCVFNSITYAIASDLTTDPVARAVYFGYMGSVAYVVNLLGPALASVTMGVSLQFPFYIGLVALGMGILLVSRMVERDADEQEALLSSPVLKATEPSSYRSHVHHLLGVVTSRPRNFSLLLLSFLLTSLASSDTKMLVQYISGRYQWTFASAGYLLSGKAVVNFTLLTVVVPWLIRRTFTTGNTDVKNVQYAKYCLGISVLGAMGIAVSSTIASLIPWLLIYALGSALPVFTLSLLKSPSICPATDEHIFSIVMLTKTMGSLLGAPLMAYLWVHGLGLGGMALGMPFFVSGSCYVLAAVVFNSIRVDVT